MRARRTPARIAAAAVLTIAAAVILVGPALAGENDIFGAAPHPSSRDGVARRGFDIPATAGASFQDSLLVSNRTASPITLLVYPAEAKTGKDGVIAVGLRDAKTTGLSSWITMKVTSVSLPAKGQRLVPFTVRVDSANPASAQAAIVTEAAPGTGPQGLALVQRVAILVKLVAPGTAGASPAVVSSSGRGFLPWAGGIGAVLALGAGFVVWMWKRRDREERSGRKRAPVSQLPSRVVPAQRAVAAGGAAHGSTAVSPASRRSVAFEKPAREDRQAETAFIAKSAPAAEATVLRLPPVGTIAASRARHPSSRGGTGRRPRSAK